MMNENLETHPAEVEQSPIVTDDFSAEGSVDGHIEQGRQQIRLLFEDMPEGYYSNLFSLKLKRNGLGQIIYDTTQDGSQKPQTTTAVRWFSSVAEATSIFEDWAQDPDRNVYISKGFFDKPLDGGKRGTLRDMSGILYLASDVDYCDIAHHNGKQYPTTMNDALMVINETLPKPTMTIQTGHGLLPVLKLAEPLFDLDKAEELASRLQQQYSDKATEYDWTIDSASDCVRPIRLAGSTNYNQPKQPVPVRVVDHDPDRKHSTECLDEHLPLLRPENNRTYARIDADGLSLNPEVQPSSVLLVRLMQNEQFMKTWTGERNLPSQSEYDLSIANFVVGAGGTAQDCADFIITHRRTHDQDLKLTRDYFERTIGKAMSGKDDKSFQDRLPDLVLEVHGEGISTLIAKHRRDEVLTDEERATIIQSINEDLGLDQIGKPLTGVKRALLADTKCSITTWTLEFGPIGYVTVNGFSELISSSKALSKISERLNARISLPKKVRWNTIVDKILAVAVDEEVAPECTPLGNTKRILKDYLDGRSWYGDYEQAREDKVACLDGEYIWFWAHKLLENLTGAQRNEFYKRLRAIGCKQASKRRANNQIDTTWRIEWRTIYEESELRARLLISQDEELPASKSGLTLPEGYSVNLKSTPEDSTDSPETM